ncbi:hypothetical protein GLAREA_13009 [Glarea lozoyensis ATCC 20868]|uniref:Uncharacterized protein n=1 Tax=Glarea lozoyensis (strain ATCC 20868 / MF5171) TaxID=1116229 RepID=S3DEB1_GLAL2|nr:uncharacterized protein GLAREA_13009 [Glarea lozoyensis ATCC 20868]EPE30286.1 hypothetical protein GLAREA_13009 [Glarea lozoyensis ATCC 20868]
MYIILTTTLLTLLTTTLALPTQPPCTIPHLSISFDDAFLNNTHALPLFPSCSALAALIPSLNALQDIPPARAFTVDFGVLRDANLRPLPDTNPTIKALTKKFGTIEVFRLAIAVEVQFVGRGDVKLEAEFELTKGVAGVATSEPFRGDGGNVGVRG